MKEQVPVQQTSQQLLRRSCQCISLRLTVESTATILVDIHTNPKLKCASLYTYLSHRIQSHARLVDSPSSCSSPALSPSLLPPPLNFYKYVIHVDMHAYMHINSSCLLYMYRRIPQLCPPPLCMLGLGKSGEGAYTRDPYISM